MSDKDPYRGLPSLERMESDLGAAESRVRPARWFSRHRRMLGAVAALVATGLLLSPVGPAYALYDGEPDWQGPGVAEEWDCASATAIPEEDATLLLACKAPPLDALENVPSLESDVRPGAPGRGVTVLLEDGEAARLPTFEDLAAVRVPVDLPGAGAPPRGVTGPSGFRPSSLRRAPVAPPLSALCRRVERSK